MYVLTFPGFTKLHFLIFNRVIEGNVVDVIPYDLGVIFLLFPQTLQEYFRVCTTLVISRWSSGVIIYSAGRPRHKQRRIVHEAITVKN